MAPSMMVTEVGDKIIWRQLRDVIGESCHQVIDVGTNIKKRHRHKLAK